MWRFDCFSWFKLHHIRNIFKRWLILFFHPFCYHRNSFPSYVKLLLDIQWSYKTPVKKTSVLNYCTDTLLNVFLAIAVDNLANAQILTEDEENEKRERELNRARNKQRYTHNGKGWGRAGAKLPVVMAINHFVRKRNGNAPTSAEDPPTTAW